MSNDVRLGSLLKKIREEQNISIERIADFMGVNIQTIIEYEDNTYPLTIAAVQKYCAYLNIDPFDIINGKIC